MSEEKSEYGKNCGQEKIYPDGLTVRPIYIYIYIYIYRPPGVGTPNVNGLKEVCAARISTKTEYSSKGR